MIVLVLAALAVGLAARSSHGAGPERTYVVKPTDTLWSIAARSYAGDVREGVWKLQQRNHLARTHFERHAEQGLGLAVEAVDGLERQHQPSCPRLERCTQGLARSVAGVPSAITCPQCIT